MSRMVTKFAYESPRLGSGETGLNDALKALMREVGLDPEAFRGRMQDVRPALQKAKRERATRLGLAPSDFLATQLTDDWSYFVFPKSKMAIHPEGPRFLSFLPHKRPPRQF